MKLTFFQRLQFAWQAFKNSRKVINGLLVAVEYESDYGMKGRFLDHKGRETVKPFLF